MHLKLYLVINLIIRSCWWEFQTSKCSVFSCYFANLWIPPYLKKKKKLQRRHLKLALCEVLLGNVKELIAIIFIPVSVICVYNISINNILHGIKLIVLIVSKFVWFMQLAYEIYWEVQVSLYVVKAEMDINYSHYPCLYL